MSRYVDALAVTCPACERKPGFPCQKLSGVTSARMWTPDEHQGGWVGYADAKHPHVERRALAQVSDPSPTREDNDVRQ